MAEASLLFRQALQNRCGLTAAVGWPNYRIDFGVDVRVGVRQMVSEAPLAKPCEPLTTTFTRSPTAPRLATLFQVGSGTVHQRRPQDDLVAPDKRHPVGFVAEIYSQAIAGKEFLCITGNFFAD